MYILVMYYNTTKFYCKTTYRYYFIPYKPNKNEQNNNTDKKK